MLKTICLLALIAVAYNQDAGQAVNDAVNSVVQAGQAVQNGAADAGQQVNDAVNQVAQAAQTTTVGDAVNQVQANLNAIESSVPVLNSLTVGWGNREVVVTPQAANPTLNDWLNGNDNVARVTGDAADGEWTLQWSVENGDDYALLHQNNGDFVIVDTTTNTNNNWGANDNLDTEIAHGAEQLVDYVWDNEVSMVQGSTITDWLANVLNNNNVNGFLQDNNDETVANAAANALNQVVANNPAAVDTANQAAANNPGLVDAANQAVGNVAAP